MSLNIEELKKIAKDLRAFDVNPEEYEGDARLFAALAVQTVGFITGFAAAGERVEAVLDGVKVKEGPLFERVGYLADEYGKLSASLDLLLDLDEEGRAAALVDVQRAAAEVEEILDAAGIAPPVENLSRTWAAVARIRALALRAFCSGPSLPPGGGTRLEAAVSLVVDLVEGAGFKEARSRGDLGVASLVEGFTRRGVALAALRTLAVSYGLDAPDAFKESSADPFAGLFEALAAHFAEVTPLRAALANHGLSTEAEVEAAFAEAERNRITLARVLVLLGAHRRGDDSGDVVVRQIAEVVSSTRFPPRPTLDAARETSLDMADRVVRVGEALVAAGLAESLTEIGGFDDVPRLVEALAEEALAGRAEIARLTGERDGYALELSSARRAAERFEDRLFVRLDALDGESVFGAIDDRLDRVFALAAEALATRKRFTSAGSLEEEVDGLRRDTADLRVEALLGATPGQRAADFDPVNPETALRLTLPVEVEWSKGLPFVISLPDGVEVDEYPEFVRASSVTIENPRRFPRDPADVIRWLDTVDELRLTHATREILDEAVDEAGEEGGLAAASLDSPDVAEVDLAALRGLLGGEPEREVVEIPVARLAVFDRGDEEEGRPYRVTIDGDFEGLFEVVELLRGALPWERGGEIPAPLAVLDEARFPPTVPPAAADVLAYKPREPGAADVLARLFHESFEAASSEESRHPWGSVSPRFRARMVEAASLVLASPEFHALDPEALSRENFLAWLSGLDVEGIAHRASVAPSGVAAVLLDLELDLYGDHSTPRRPAGEPVDRVVRIVEDHESGEVYEVYSSGRRKLKPGCLLRRVGGDVESGDVVVFGDAEGRTVRLPAREFLATRSGEGAESDPVPSPAVAVQPPPEGEAGEVWPLVFEYVEALDVDASGLLADMRERDAVGRERYGTPLRLWNGRDALVDAYQEALDLVVYLRQCATESGSDVVSGWFRDAVDLSLRFKGYLSGERVDGEGDKANPFREGILRLEREGWTDHLLREAVDSASPEFLSDLIDALFVALPWVEEEGCSGGEGGSPGNALPDSRVAHLRRDLGGVVVAGIGRKGRKWAARVIDSAPVYFDRLEAAKEWADVHLRSRGYRTRVPNPDGPESEK